MRENKLQCISPEGFHNMCYTDWGDINNKETVVCVHGLIRNSRDFDWIAKELSAKRRVVCPDIVGRGNSSWLNVATNYTYPQYMGDCTNLIARLNVDKIDWIGTSMGGIVGIMIAACPNTPIKRLIINDVGPVLSEATCKNILEYAANKPSFKNEESALRYIKEIYAPFLSKDIPEYWQHLLKHSFNVSNGKFQLKYDVKIPESALINKLTSLNIWPMWDAISCPILLLRGKNSTLLSEKLAAEMKARKKKQCTLVTFDNVGHAPSLAEAEQIKVVSDWLDIAHTI